MNFRKNYLEAFSCRVEEGHAFGSCLVFLMTFCAIKEVNSLHGFISRHLSKPIDGDGRPQV